MKKRLVEVPGTVIEGVRLLRTVEVQSESSPFEKLLVLGSSLQSVRSKSTPETAFSPAQGRMGLALARSRDFGGSSASSPTFGLPRLLRRQG